tara:strand:+ start:5589 stop:6947 length:1359 start_codon:yes stop_codon:yes gene_type:complete
MVFGRIYDLQPEPQFFNAKQFKEEGFSKFKKAKRAVRRGVVLFVDAPPVKYTEVRRRPFSGSGGSNSQIKANPQMANFYQLNKIALSQMNKKVLERTQAKIDPLKIAELALLAKINDNLEKKETAVSIAQTDPPEDEPEMVDKILQAQGDLSNIEEENNVLKEQLKQTRQQLNILNQEKKAVEEDEERDRQILEQFDKQMLEERAKVNEEIVKSNDNFVIERFKVFEPSTRPSQPAQPQPPVERVGADIQPEPEEPITVELSPETASVAQKIAMFERGGGGGLPQEEKLVEEGEELVLTEEQEEAFRRKLGEAEKKKPRRRTPLEQQMITSKAQETRFTNELALEKRLRKRNKTQIPLLKQQIDEANEELIQVRARSVVTKQEKSNKTRRINQIISNISRFRADIMKGEEQLANYKERRKMLKDRINLNKQRKLELLQQLEDEEQLKALREN